MEKNIIMFDFDNTLVNSLKYWYKVQENLMFKKYGAKPTPEMERRRHGKNNREVAELFIELSNAKVDYTQIYEDWFNYMEFFYTKKIKMLKNAKQFLLNLKQQGKKLVLASATEFELLQVALKHFGLFDLFDEVYTETIMGYAKIQPEFFDELLTRLNATPEEIFFFEDSYGSIKNATAKGIEVCAVVHKYNKKHLPKLIQMCKLVIKNYNNKQIHKLF